MYLKANNKVEATQERILTHRNYKFSIIHLHLATTCGPAYFTWRRYSVLAPHDTCYISTLAAVYICAESI
jgi:hypothetical protein